MVSNTIVGHEKRSRLMILAATLYGVHTLSIIQGVDGPLAFLKSPSIALACILLSLLIAVMLRIRNPTLGFRWQVPFVAALVIFMFFGEIVNDASFAQFSLIVIFLLPFLVAATVPTLYRSYLLSGLLVSGVIQCVVALFFGPYVPTLSGVPQLSAGLQPNVLAFIAAAVSVYGVFIAVSGAAILRTVLGVLVALIGGLVVILTVSRTGLLAMLVGVAFVVGAKVRLRGILSGAAALAILILAYFALSLPLGPFEDWFVRGDEASISSLTGRTYIWETSWSFFGERPVLGWGFGALYSPDFTGGQFLTLVRGTNSHNAWLQLLVETGVLVAVMSAVLYVSLWARCALAPMRERPLLMGLAATLTFNSFGSASFATLGFAACLVASLYLAARPTMLADRGRVDYPHPANERMRS